MLHIIFIWVDHTPQSIISKVLDLSDNLLSKGPVNNNCQKVHVSIEI